MYWKYPQNPTRHRKLFTGLDEYNRNTEVIGEIIKEREYDLDSYDKVEN